MVKCDKCGHNLVRSVKFCSNCGDVISWPEVEEVKKGNSNAVDDFVKEKGTEILYDNIPEEYIDKIKDDISNFEDIRNDPNRSIIEENERLSNTKESILKATGNIKQSGDDFISKNKHLSTAKDTILNTTGAVRKSGSDFINDNVSDDSKQKIISGAGNISKSTRKFFGNADEILSNIQSHRSKVQKQKREERKIQKQKKKAEKEQKREQFKKEQAEKRERAEISRQETHQKNIIRIRANRSAGIEIPQYVATDDVMSGAIKGEMIGSAAGRAAEGLFGNKDSLSRTVNAGLVLGGVGSLVGGLAAASDDGIRWSRAQLYIGDDELIISGKYSIPFTEIKMISTGKYKYSDIIIFTLQNQGLEFKTDDASALKIVIEEYIQKYNSNKKKPGNVDDLLKYGELYERGIITKEELEEKKKELL